MTTRVARLKALLIDDEAPARHLLSTLIAGDDEISIVGECQDGQEAIVAIRDLRPDIVFLDIQMPHIDGFEVIQQVGLQHMPVVIFVTAYDAYAIKAFEVHAVDYLLKPFSRARFTQALQHAKLLVRTKHDSTQRTHLRSLLRDWQYHSRESEPDRTSDTSAFLQKIMVRDRDRIRSIDLRQVIWLEAADHYVMVHTTSGNFLVYEAMASLERTLPPSLFVRIHRGAIVSTAHVKQITPARFSSCYVVLSTGEKLRLSRTRRHTLQLLLNHQS